MQLAGADISPPERLLVIKAIKRLPAVFNPRAADGVEVLASVLISVSLRSED